MFDENWSVKSKLPGELIYLGNFPSIVFRTRFRWCLQGNKSTSPTLPAYTQVTTSWTYVTCRLPGSLGSSDGNRVRSQVISLLAQIFQVCFVHNLKEKSHLNAIQATFRKDFTCDQQLTSYAHLTDVVGINFSLDELGQVCWQTVFVKNFFSFGFVGNLKEGKKCINKESREEGLNDTGR